MTSVYPPHTVVATDENDALKHVVEHHINVCKECQSWRDDYSDWHWLNWVILSA